MRRTRLFLIIALIALPLAGAALWQRHAHEASGAGALERGLAALDRGDARTARVELMNAIKADPRSISTRFAQARALLALEDGADARAELDRVRALGGAVPPTRAPMAEALLLQGDAGGALREAGAPDVPSDQAADAARVAGRALLAQGRLAPAQASLQRAIALAPRDPRGWVDLGRFRIASGDQAGAILAADRAVALAPADPKALALRGELTRDQYGLTAALPWFERALAVDPDNVPILAQYAATLADAGQAGRMLAVTRHMLALDPGNPRAYLMQAVMAARADNPDLARALLDRTGGQLDGEPATLLLRGVLHLDSGNPVLAAEALGRLVALQPDNRTARALLGRAYMETGDTASAASTLAPIVARRDADPYVLTLAARAQEALGQRAVADDMLARAAWPMRPAAEPFASPRDVALADMPPANVATARDNIPYIRALLSTGRAGEALDRARLLARANPGAPAAQLILGDALDAAGHATDAVRAYEAAANIRFDRDTAFRLAAAWTRVGKPVRATQIVRLFLSQNPEDVGAQRLAAAAAMQARDWRTALRLLQAVRRQTGGHDAMLMADLARASLETGDAKNACAYAAYAYRLLPASPMTADMFGYTLLRTGSSGQPAVDLLEKAVALAPGHPLLQMHLGQAYAAVGRKDEAYALLTQAAAVPGNPYRRQAVEALAAL